MRNAAEGGIFPFSLLEVIARCRHWRQATDTITFVSGCFDVLHAGHLHLLETARQLGQRLIVAVNNDDYCRRAKGPTRPVQSCLMRCRIVQAVSHADLVLEFADATPERLLERIQPDIYVLGSDYRETALAGAQWCGKVVFIERLPGLSTTTALRACGYETGNADHPSGKFPQTEQQSPYKTESQTETKVPTVDLASFPRQC